MKTLLNTKGRDYDENQLEILMKLQFISSVNG